MCGHTTAYFLDKQRKVSLMCTLSITLGLGNYSLRACWAHLNTFVRHGSTFKCIIHASIYVRRKNHLNIDSRLIFLREYDDGGSSIRSIVKSHVNL